MNKIQYVKENLMDKVSSMTVDEFITALEDNNGSESNSVIDSLIIAVGRQNV